MECFYHDATQAVGICKHCNKALCHHCLTDTGDGLACTKTCVQDVQDLNRLIDRSRNTAPLTNRNAYLTPTFLGICGAALLAVSFLSERDAGLPLAMGSVFLLLACLYYYRMRQWVNAAEAATNTAQRHG